MQNNEESELKIVKSNLFPQFGSVYVFYNYYYAVHKLVIAFYTPYKCAFELEPHLGTVIFDFYLDAIFFINILITFNIPLYDQKSRLITDRKIIAMKYLRTWFILDVLVCFPFSYFRKIS